MNYQESSIEKSINDINRSYFIYKMSNKVMNSDGRISPTDDSVIELLDQHHFLIQRIENLIHKPKNTVSIAPSRKRVYSTTSTKTLKSTTNTRMNSTGHNCSNGKNCYWNSKMNGNKNINRNNSLLLKSKFIDVNQNYSFGNQSNEDKKKDKRLLLKKGVNNGESISTASTSSPVEIINIIQSQKHPQTKTHMQIYPQVQDYKGRNNRHTPLGKTVVSNRLSNPTSNDMMVTYENISQRYCNSNTNNKNNSRRNKSQSRNLDSYQLHYQLQKDNTTNKTDYCSSNCNIIIAKPKTIDSLETYKITTVKKAALPNTSCGILHFKQRLFSK